MMLLRNVEYCKNNKKLIKPVWLQKDIYDIEIPSNISSQFNDASINLNTSININTSTNKEFLDKIDVSLNPSSIKTAQPESKKRIDRSTNKNSITTSVNKSVSRKRGTSKLRKVRKKSYSLGCHN